MATDILQKHHWQRWQRTWRRLPFTRTKRIEFLEDILALMKDGISLVQSLEAIQTLDRGIKCNVAQHVSQVIAEGKLLADGLQQWFSKSIVEIIRAGETGGTLLAALESAVRTLRDQKNSWAGFLQATLYPITVLCLALGLLVFIKHSVFVSFIAIKPLALWPSIGQNLFHLATWIEDSWWAWILLFILLAFAVYNACKQLIGPTRFYLDKLPVFALYRANVAARLMQTLGLLMQNGMVLKRALNVMQLDAEPYLSWHLMLMEMRLSAGSDNIADVLATRLVSADDLVRLRIISRGKGLAQALVRLGAQAHERNLKTLSRIGKIIGGILLISSAILAASVILGIYSIGSSLT